MDSLEFILIVAVIAVVLRWYLMNAEAKSDGLLGFLALKDDPETAEAPGRKSYRIKARARRGAAALDDSRDAEAPKTYRTLEEGERMRRRFRRQDEARYRVKDLAAGYKPDAQR